MASPLIEQYLDLKSQHPDKVLFFRLGDFYEMFFDDAIEVSSVLNLVLTKRKNKVDGQIPMCGIPYHSSEGYLEKLIQKGYQVAIAEQVEKAKPGKDLVRREVVRVVTQATILLESSTDAIQTDTHVASITSRNKESYIAILSTITGRITLTKAPNSDINEVLRRFNVHEVIGKISEQEHAWKVVSPPPYISKKTSKNLEKLAQKLKVFSLDVYNVPRGTLFEKPLSGLIWYLESIHAENKISISEIVYDIPENLLVIDEQTRKNLEIFPYEGKRTSLWDILHQTKTAMGSRLLQHWMSSPTKDQKTLQERTQSIQWIKENNLWESFRSQMQGIKDLERLVAKTSYGTLVPTQMLELASSISLAKNCIQSIQKNYPTSHEMRSLHNTDVNKIDIEEYICRIISPHATNNRKDGNIIRSGISEQLDELKNISKNGKKWLLDYQTKLKEDLSIPTLKVGFNKVFGYYVEVSKTHAAKIPETYTKKQTLVNAERFITDELKEYESKILSAEEKIIELEHHLFEEVCGKVVENSDVILNLAKCIGWLDVVSSQAKVSSDYNYSKPEYIHSGECIIEDGRHPIIETLLPENEFISNSTTFNDQISSYILTGPNMGGKSTYIRQIALIAYMAHLGLHVPAKKLKISPIDRIFSRVGASDNLSEGQSTFMVEMTEVANILKNATSQSLVILDEVGRGTSTTDGRALAKSVVEYIHQNIKSKMIFATHFHELASLESKHPKLKNIHVSVDEKDNKLIFYHQIKLGSASKSYGIEIARLAGVPSQVIDSAFQNIQEHSGQVLLQPSIFEASKWNNNSDTCNDILKTVKEIEINNITPLEALQKLNDLKKEIHDKDS